MGRLYAIMLSLMLHFSFVFGFFVFLRGIFHCGFIYVCAMPLEYERMLGHLDEMANGG